MSSPVYQHPDVARLISSALDEDLRAIGDLTCQALVPPTARLQATVTAKAPGVVCAVELFAQTLAQLHQRGLGTVTIEHSLPDGAVVAVGDVVWRAQGDANALLQGERTALNLVQRLSGTSTLTRRYVEAVRGTRAGIFDTRKTTPGMRLLQKLAVTSGGGRNHRIGLYDQVLIKENHLALMGGARTASPAAEAVARCRAQLGGSCLIEVEIERLEDLEPVILSGADIVLLDNLGGEVLAEAVRRRDRVLRPGMRLVELEASGGITLESVRPVALSGVERISTGELTHSVRALDLSMRCHPL